MTNKVSQNLHAEFLLRAVAHEKKGFGVTDAGIWAEQDFLKTMGVADGDVVFTDGSGLSRDDLVTPRAVVQLLRWDAAAAVGRGLYFDVSDCGAGWHVGNADEGYGRVGTDRGEDGSFGSRAGDFGFCYDFARRAIDIFDFRKQ